MPDLCSLKQAAEGSGETVKSPKHTGCSFSSSSPNSVIHSHHRLHRHCKTLHCFSTQGDQPKQNMFASRYVGCHCDYFGIILPAMISRSSLVGLRRSRNALPGGNQRALDREHGPGTQKRSELELVLSHFQQFTSFSAPPRTQIQMRGNIELKAHDGPIVLLFCWKSHFRYHY